MDRPQWVVDLVIPHRQLTGRVTVMQVGRGVPRHGAAGANASTDEQVAAIGTQTGGRVFLFLATDDFWRDYTEMCGVGIQFVREPKEAPYGT